MIISKFIWFWQVPKYLHSGHTIINDCTCGFLQRRADKFVADWDHRSGHINYLPTGYWPLHMVSK